MQDSRGGLSSVTTNLCFCRPVPAGWWRDRSRFYRSDGWRISTAGVLDGLLDGVFI